jgi:CheY-like chemotaxis protein
MPGDQTRPAVLIVDDDADIRDLVGDCLEAERYQVHTAPDGRQALDALRLGLRPSVIFLDLMMPIVSGFDVLIALRNSPDWRAIPVVIFTASHDGNARDLDGAFEILRKPADLDAVLASAQKAIAVTHRDNGAASVGGVR